MVEFGPLVAVGQEPALYILMRNDLESLNPGKAVAQGAHAANQFTDSYKENDPPDPLFEEWKKMGDGFGTTLCLELSIEQIYQAVRLAEEAGFKAGVTHDSSYPIRDGRITHLVPLDTCGYIFGEKADLKILLGQFGLMP